MISNPTKTPNVDDQLPATPLRLGAEKLDKTILSAGYWLDSARIQHRKSEVLMCAEQSINHWKNAAYHFAEEHSKLEARIAERTDLLREAKSAIRIFHGHECWDIYDQHSPEMKRINAALLATPTSEGAERG